MPCSPVWARLRASLTALLFALPVLASAQGVLAQPIPVPDIAPEAATHQSLNSRPLAQAEHYMVSAANPLATKAGLSMLEQGGSVVDAAIAAQLVLGLVEPQSSGLGGGGFALVHQAGEAAVHAYDGRETATAAARPGRFLHEGRPLNFFDAVDSGLSVGTPGLVSMLADMHKDGGRLPWAQLFQPAIRLATEGFEVSPRMHAMVAASKGLKASASAAAYFYDEKGEAWPVGHVLRNPDYADVLRQLAQEGAQAFYQGELARDMVEAVAAHEVPGDLTVEDLAAYRSLKREALCADVGAYRYCGMPPPSSGGLAVVQMMALLQHTPIAGSRPDSAEAVHYFSEAGRLAFADRDAYVADPAFAQVPVYGLLDPDYLASRAALIRPERSMGKAEPGVPAGLLETPPTDTTLEQPATTHLVVADRQGNAVSMTTSVESAFGSKIFVNGYLLNNQMTDFALNPVDAQGRPHINRVEAGKRPRSSMSPMMVFKGEHPVLAVGSPGGSAIINYVAKTLVGTLVWNMDIQAAIDLPNMGSRNHATEIERHTSLTRAAATLKAMGHDIQERDFPSGLHGVMWVSGGLHGGADPRREGLALGR
ncbi:MAG: gamma-glutamyltransferase [Alcaligenaceae bacterium]|nr:gamma-glutamyltransferase [Alcaligenaceae bacterium]